MDKTQYNQCIASGLKGKKFSKEQRQLEFCIVSKLCSKKVPNRTEAERVCKLPKPPKPIKSNGARSEKAIIKMIETEMQCIIPKINMSKASNVNTLEVELANAMFLCRMPNDKTEDQ